MDILAIAPFYIELIMMTSRMTQDPATEYNTTEYNGTSTEYNMTSTVGNAADKQYGFFALKVSNPSLSISGHCFGILFLCAP